MFNISNSQTSKYFGLKDFIITVVILTVYFNRCCHLWTVLEQQLLQSAVCNALLSYSTAVLIYFMDLLSWKKIK